MRILRLCSFGFLLAFLLGPASPLQAQQGTLSGRVTQAGTGLALGSAQISIRGSGQSTGTLSNDTGNYRIELPAGTYDVTYVLQVESINVDEVLTISVTSDAGKKQY